MVCLRSSNKLQRNEECCSNNRNALLVIMLVVGGLPRDSNSLIHSTQSYYSAGQGILVE
jgi:hypothetical protein